MNLIDYENGQLWYRFDADVMAMQRTSTIRRRIESQGVTAEVRAAMSRDELYLQEKSPKKHGSLEQWICTPKRTGT